MFVSLEWLNDYVDLDGLSPEVIAEALTNAGLEVESIDHVGGQFDGVIVGKIEAVEKHPNADRLNLVTVNIGNQSNKVVCGAQNVQPNIRIAYAQIGATILDRKNGGTFELKPITIRGVESTGMICAISELGLETLYTVEEEGIWPIDALCQDSHIGQDLKTALNLSPDTVLDVTPNANRGDLMGMIGVAREVAALFKRPLKRPELQARPEPSNTDITVRLDNPEVCPYYAGAVLSNISLGESPDWMRRRLTHAGVRSINNVVDITNYVLLEFGQPLHAFDKATLTDTTIGVRCATEQETFDTLDDVQRTLTTDSVVVTCGDTPVALAGVMGGKHTEVTEKTQTILLEAAYFPGASTRKSARSVGLRSESSARFERGTDPLGCENGFQRAIDLLCAHANATLVSWHQADHRSHETLTIDLSAQRIERILGIAIPQEEALAILNTLGFEATAKDANTMAVTIPSFRQDDVYREIDLIEELIRIYGYDKVPYTLPQGSAAPMQTFRETLLQQIRQGLTGMGLTEVITHSLIGDSLLEKTRFPQDADKTVRVRNSQSIDHTFLRHSVLPNLLEVARYNQAQGNPDMWAFELGRTYTKQQPCDVKNAGVAERLQLSGMLMGKPAHGTWHQHTTTDFYTLKGVIESLLNQLSPQQRLRWAPEKDHHTFHPGRTARLKIGKIDLGILGQLHPALQDQLKLKTPVFLFELDAETLYEHLKKQSLASAITPLSVFPAVERDIAFSAPIELSHQKIMAAINQVNNPLIQQVTLFDEYTGEQLEQGQRSLAYRITLQSSEGTLKDAEIDTTMNALRDHLSKELSVIFR